MSSPTMLELSDGSVALIDADDIARVSMYSWRRSSPRAHVSPIGQKWSTDHSADEVYLDRYIVNAGPGDVVMHLNRDMLDNRRENLVVIGRMSDARSEHVNTCAHPLTAAVVGEHLANRP